MDALNSSIPSSTEIYAMKQAMKVQEQMVSKMLEANGTKFDDGMEYGFTEGTMVIHLEKFDVQLKPIAPKRGVERYEKKA